MKYFFWIILFFSEQLFPQNVFIAGKVTDSQNKNPLASANVLLYHFPDSSMQGTITNEKGNFRFENVKSGKNKLVIKYLGFQDFICNLEVTNKSIHLDTISLLTDSIMISEVLIIDKIPVVSQSGDTTVYNADAFKVNKDAVAEDLLAKIPGIQLENGKVKAQGEEVKKVYVDGKTFFGEDPNAALKNLPADIIEKVQVFDQNSEQSQFSGFDDGNTNKAINIVTRLNIQKGTFGKLFAGYGTEDRYNTGGNVNFFNDDQRISFVGQLNNTNEQNFSSMDLLGIMSGESLGGRGAPGGMNGPGFGGGEPGSLIASQNGDTKTSSFGVNYNDKWNDDFEFGSSYFFNNTDNNITSLLSKDYFISTYAGQRYVENSLSENRNTNHRINLRFDYQVDSVNQIRFIPSFSIQKNNTESFVTGYTNTGEERLNYTSNSTLSNLSGINLSSLLMYRHKFNTSGRSISLSLNANHKKNDGTKNLVSESIYYNSFVDSDTVNQSIDMLNTGTTLTANLVYTEPINENNFLMFNASHSVSLEKNDKETYNFYTPDNSYSLFDTSLSNIYQRNYTTSAAGISYRYKKNKVSLNANLNYSIASLKGEQEYPVSFNLRRKFNSFIPSLIFRYNISRDRNFNIFYRTFNNAPSVSQLQDVIDNSNPLQLSAGNPNLEQEYVHFAAVRFSTINFSNMHSLFLMLSGTYKHNYIGNKTIIAGSDTVLANGITLNQGSQLSIPENVDGYASIQSFITYGMPANFISSNFNINLSANYTRTPGITNGASNYSNVMKYGLGAVISSNISTDIDFLVSTTSYYNTVKNNISKENDDEYLSMSNRLRFYWLLFDQLVFQSELNHKYDGGLSEQYDPNTYLLNLSLGMKFFSDNSGEIKFSVYDALNQNNNISRQSTDYYTQEYSSNVIGRYFLLSLIYNLRTFY